MMDTPQTIIKKLKTQGMSYTSIGASIGVAKETISRIASGKQSGKTSLAKLEKLAIASGISLVPSYVPSNDPTKPRKPDIAPLTQEQLALEDEQDKYEEWQQFAPVAKTVGRAIDGVRGKIVESLLPDDMSLVKSYKVPERARVVVESAPRPHKPRQRKARVRQYAKPAYTPQYSLGAVAGAVLASLVVSDRQQSMQAITSPSQPQTVTRYQPTMYLAPTEQYITLAYPRNGIVRPSPLGYAPQPVGEPIQPHVNYGRIRMQQ